MAETEVTPAPEATDEALDTVPPLADPTPPPIDVAPQSTSPRKAPTAAEALELVKEGKVLSAEHMALLRGGAAGMGMSSKRGPDRVKAAPPPGNAPSRGSALSFAAFQASASLQPDPRKKARGHRGHHAGGARSSRDSSPTNSTVSMAIGATSSDMDEVRRSALDAKRQLAQLQRELRNAKAEGAHAGVVRANHDSASQMRARATNQALRRALSKCKPASEEEVRELAEGFNGRMCEMYDDPQVRA